jgi:glycyl-tRNA synthetase beta chain
MTDFLLELRSEEIPARMQDDARQNLKRLFEAELAKAGLKADDIATFATPRRLALIAHGLPLETQAVSEELKGPKTTAPPQALEGFLRKTGLTQDQLVERDGVYFAVINKPGRATADVLAEAIPAIIRAFPWPKSMRWGDASASTESLRWVRPLQGIVALFGDDVVACEVDGIVSGSATMGHRFHHSGPVTIGNAGDYETKLRACHVIVDPNERENIIREGALKAAANAGLVLVQDPGLVTENAGLTEWPVPLLGRFDPAFLSVPEEVIQLTARVNQKYFVCQDAGGKLANAFVCTANIVAKDGGAAIVAGNEKVLAARMSDAKFFWEADLKVRLEDQATKLSSIVFHEKLGTVADKVERVAKLARWLVESGVVKSSPERGGFSRPSRTRSAPVQGRSRHRDGR